MTAVPPRQHPRVVLRVRGKDYGGWSSIKVEQGMEALTKLEKIFPRG